MAKIEEEKRKNEEIDKELSFNLIVQKIRWKHMIAAITSKNPEKREQGMRILKNVARLLKTKKVQANKEQGFDEHEFDQQMYKNAFQ